MNDTITTAAELDALLMAVSVSAEAAVIMHNSRPYLITEDEWGEFWAWSYQCEDEERPYVSAEGLPLPWTVLWRPDQRCRSCGGTDGAHSPVHRRNPAGGGGANLPCPDQPVTTKPTVEAVAQTIIREAALSAPPGSPNERFISNAARAVLALLPGRTEPEVIAEYEEAQFRKRQADSWAASGDL